MKRYTVDNQNYQIFKVQSGTKTPFVHFQWGKFDFRMNFETAENAATQNPQNTFVASDGCRYLPGTFEILYKDEWFEFIKPTAHGMQLEETLWRREGQDYFAEFPKDLLSSAQGFCAEELGFSPYV